MASLPERPEAAYDEEHFALSDLLNRVLDRGVVISGSVTISVADIDLVEVDLHVLIYAVESAARRLRERAGGAGAAPARTADGDLPVLPPDRAR